MEAIAQTRDCTRAKFPLTETLFHVKIRLDKSVFMIWLAQNFMRQRETGLFTLVPPSEEGDGKLWLSMIHLQTF